MSIRIQQKFFSGVTIHIALLLSMLYLRLQLIQGPSKAPESTETNINTIKVGLVIVQNVIFIYIKQIMVVS